MERNGRAIRIERRESPRPLAREYKMSIAKSLGGVLIALVATVTAATSQPPILSPEDELEPILGDDGSVLSGLGIIQITLLSRDRFAGITLAQTTPRGKDKPEALAVHVPYPANPEWMLTCFILRDDQRAFRTASTGDFMTPFEPITGEAKAMMEDLAAQIEIATKGLNFDQIGFGILHKFPDSVFAALDRVLAVDGGCNWSAAVKTAAGITPSFESAPMLSRSGASR
jgi:hypothetical protein